ncbi:MAG: AAA family ATPase [Candidatus Moranbacteria bacterium]|nr:AAA family ATPase [Candidatus Moranbacteria bacterium]
MINFQKELKKLNPGQKEAVETTEGQVMVIAGPGTGKTHVLSMRIVNILKKNKAKGEEILALTFSESAATEMKNRLIKYLGIKAYDVNVNTFHGFCNDLILENIEKFKLKKELTALDELKRTKIIKSIILKNNFEILKPFGDPFHYKGDIIKKIAELKKEGISYKKYQDIVEQYKNRLLSTREENINSRTQKPKQDWQKDWKNYQKNKDLLKIYKLYQKKCQKFGYYDFEDMIIWVLEKLDTDKDFRDSLVGKFKYILSDEYQDTNSSQNRLIEILSSGSKNPNIFVVGDDEQAIYRFQGANLANILFFEKKFPNLKIIPININYRSNSLIVNLAESLIKKNLQSIEKSSSKKIQKKPASFNKDNFPKDPIKFYEFGDYEIEHFFIAQKIKQLNQKGIKNTDIAVICRTNQQVEEVSGFLIKSGIDVEIISNQSILKKPIIIEFMNFLKFIQKPKSDHLGFFVMSLEVFEIKNKDFFTFVYLCGQKQIHYLDYYFELINKSQNRKKSIQSNFKDFSKIKKFFQNILKWHKKSASTPALLLFEEVLNESGFLKKTFDSNDISNLNAISSLFNFVKNQSRENPNYMLKDLITDTDLMEAENIKIQEKEIFSSTNDIKVLTAHQAKGLEFEAVFLPHLYRGNWDGRKVWDKIKFPLKLYFKELKNLEKADKDQKQDDERRLFFVALTRAKNYLFLSYSENYEVLGQSREKPKSRFLEEMDQALIKKMATKKYRDQIKKVLKNKFKKVKKTKDNWQKQQREFLQKRIKNLSLSPTSLNLYLNCPKKFKFEKLFLIPMAKDKTAALGTAVHKALENFFEKFKKTGQLDKQLLLDSFEESLKSQVMTKDDFDHALEVGGFNLDKYFDFYKNCFQKPLRLEANLGKVIFEDVNLSGKLDKIEELKPKEKKEIKNQKPYVRVVDYKTKKPVSRNEILGKTKNSNGDIFRQLVFYKFLSILDKDFPYQVGEAQIDFVMEKQGQFKKEGFKISKDDIELLKETLRQVIEKIKNLEFEGTQNLRQCKFCKFNQICEKK